MKKRILSMILALCMLCTMLPTVAFAAEEVASGTCGENVTWVLDDEGTLTISGTGAMEDYEQTESTSPWYDNQDITAVVIEDGITYIGDWSFYMCTSMTDIVIPENVTSIGIQAFRQCDSLTEIALPTGLTEIGEYAFSKCDALSSVEIPAGVSTLASGLFSECSDISSLTLHEGLKKIEDEVFFMSGLDSVLLPASLAVVEENAFYGSNIYTVYFSGDAPEIHENAFNNQYSVDAYYPAGNSTWTEDKLLQYGTDIMNWIPWCPQGCSYEAAAEEPTCTAPGGTRYSCPICGDSYFEEESPALGHDYLESETVEPTCTEAGYTTHTCSVCGDSYTDSETAALGHDYVDGTCTRCGDVEFKLAAPVVEVSNIKSSGKIKLTWDAVEGAAGYNVYYSTDKGESYALLKKVSGTKLNHTSAEAGQLYYYYVTAIDENGIESEASESVYIICDLARPVISLSNVASSGKVKITWEPIEGAVKYEVYLSLDDGENYEELATTEETSYVHSNAEPGVKYRYKVMAVGKYMEDQGSFVESAYSSSKSRYCDLARPKIKLSCNADGKNKIAWNHVDGAVKYYVYRSTDGGQTFKKLTSTTKNYVVNTSSEVGKTYYYKVKAIAEESDANSAYSTVKSRTVQRPGPEVFVSLTSSGKPKLTWEAVSGATKYKVYCSTDGGYNFKYLKSTSGTKLTHSSAEEGNIYQYVVKAVIGEETRTSQIVIGPCVGFDISGSKSAKSVVTRINEYRKEYDIPTLKWYATGLNAAKIRATEMNDGYSRTEDQQYDLMEAYNCYLELDFEFDGTAEELVDIIMYNYEDYASYFMYEGFTYAVAARKGDYWAIMFG